MLSKKKNGKHITCSPSQKKYESDTITYFAKLQFPFRISKYPGCETNILTHFCTFV